MFHGFLHLEGIFFPFFLYYIFSDSFTVQYSEYLQDTNIKYLQNINPDTNKFYGGDFLLRVQRNPGLYQFCPSNFSINQVQNWQKCILLTRVFSLFKLFASFTSRSHWILVRFYPSPDWRLDNPGFGFATLNWNVYSVILLYCKHLCSKYG